MRKLVTIRRVADITPIPNKDRIVCATIDGWTIVVLRDQFNVGDPCVFFEPDCFLPTGDTRWQFLVDKKSKEFNGQTGHVLRTIRMGGVYSNGFCLTMNDCPELSECVIPDFGDQTDVTEVMGIVKYDPPEVFGRGAATKGNFPPFIPKTDEERIQNLGRIVFDREPKVFTYTDGDGKEILVTREPENTDDTEYEVTMKLDGSSLTGFSFQDQVGVCSRNLELKLDEPGSTFVDMFHLMKFDEVLPQIGDYAFQMELVGPGIQNNQEGFNEFHLFVFKVYSIRENRYLQPAERHEKYNLLYDLVSDLVEPNVLSRLHHAPVLHKRTTLKAIGLNSIADALEFADGPSVNPVVKREGVVFKRYDPNPKQTFSFKAISELWLANKK